MAKKKELTPEDLFSSIFGNLEKPEKKWAKKDIEEIFKRKDPTTKTPEQRQLLIASAIFVQNGITPETYKTLYEIAAHDPVVNLLPIDLVFNHHNEYDDEEDEYDDEEDEYDDDEDEAFPMLTNPPIPDADKKSLLLKIQLRGVTKPPLWREVKIPASLNFEELHEVIQTLFGWTNSHMWQFEKTPYSDGYRISSVDPYMEYDEGPTDVARETPVTSVLNNKGDKMVYVYDFGDNWIHDISVKEVIDEPIPHPVCTKWKSDNPMEDIGGVWGLEDMRRMADPNVKHTKAEEKEFIDNSWFDSMDDFNKFMDNHKFNLTYVNQELEAIHK